MPSLSARAEEAFLGAIISHPRQLSDLPALRAEMILPPLEPSEFTDPARRAAWTAIRRLTEVAPGTRRPEADELILATRNDPLITRDYLAHLALSAPTPHAAAVYARMISEAAIFRELARGGLPVAGGGALGRLPASRTVVSYAANLTAGWSAAADDAPGPPPQQERAIREERFLAGLIGHQELTAWIQVDPATFTAPGLREIYRAALMIDRLGEPADEVTIGWAATRIVAQDDSIAGRTTTPRTLAAAIPPGTIARLAAARVDPLTALETGRGLLGDDARAQIDARTSAARATRPGHAAGQNARQASSRGRVLASQDVPPLQRPTGHHQQYGTQVSQERS